MRKLFTPTLLKFILGFMAMILFGFVMLSAAGYYAASESADETAAVSQAG